jgi:hypothetical protein
LENSITDREAGDFIDVASRRIPIILAVEIEGANAPQQNPAGSY